MSGHFAGRQQGRKGKSAQRFDAPEMRSARSLSQPIMQGYHQFDTTPHAWASYPNTFTFYPVGGEPYAAPQHAIAQPACLGEPFPVQQPYLPPPAFLPPSNPYYLPYPPPHNEATNTNDHNVPFYPQHPHIEQPLTCTPGLPFIGQPCIQHNPNCHGHGYYSMEPCHLPIEVCRYARERMAASYVNKVAWPEAPVGFNRMHQQCMDPVDPKRCGLHQWLHEQNLQRMG